jgi:UTP--glucose-1-phosphate uridylyltransferase
MKVKKAVIPAAGLGTRFLPATKAQPKEMLPIIDIPVIQFVVEEAVASGIKDIIIITGKNKRAIEDHFDRSIELELLLEKKGKNEILTNLKKISEMANIHFIRQKEPLGLGHAIYCAKDHIGNKPFATMLGDDFYVAKTPHLKQLLCAFDRLGGSIIDVNKVSREKISRYGIIDYHKIDKKTFIIKDIIEKPNPENAPSNMAFMGRAIFMPEIFKFIKKTKPGYGGEIQLTDAIREMSKKNKTYALQCDGKRYDVGNKIEYLKAIVDYALMRNDLNNDFIKYLKSLKI